MLAKSRLRMLLVACAAVILAQGCGAASDAEATAKYIRDTERERLHALVTQNMDLADRLHAADFQLITPDGSEYSKEDYLELIESGALDYESWEAGEIRVRVYGDVAIIRYDDVRFEVHVDGQLARSGLLRHTNLYEKRDGEWQVVWSHASGGQAGP